MFQNQNGVIHFLTILAAAGIIIFLLISNTFNFKENIFERLFPKPPSSASEIKDNKDQKILSFTEELLKINKEYKTSQPAVKNGLLGKMKSKAEERKIAMLSLIESNPKLALNSSINIKQKNELPEEIKQLLEQDYQAEGIISQVKHTLFSENEEGKIKNLDYGILKDNQGNLISTIHGETLDQIPDGAKVKVYGIKLEDKMAFESSTIISDPNVLGIVHMPHYLGLYPQTKTAVILVKYEDNIQPWTTDYIKKTTFTDPTSSKSFFKENSFGKTDLVGVFDVPGGDVYGYINSLYYDDLTTRNCYLNGDILKGRLDSAATDAGINLRSYDRVIYAFYHACQTPGTYSVGSTPSTTTIMTSGSIGYTPASIVFAMTQIIGSPHQGIARAMTYQCYDDAGNRVPIHRKENCYTFNPTTGWGYTDPFDVMGGYNTRHMSFGKAQANYLSNAESNSEIETVTESKTIYISPLEIASGLYPKIVRIPRDDKPYYPNCNTYLYLTYSQPYGFDNYYPTDHIVNGVAIRIADEYQSVWDNSVIPEKLLCSKDTKSSLIDTTAGGYENYYDAPLVLNEVFNDNYGTKHSIRLITEEVTPTYAKIGVFIHLTGSSCTLEKPYARIVPTTQYGSKGTLKRYTLSLTNNDAPSCIASVFTIVPTGTVPTNWAYQLQQNGITDLIPPGETKNYTIDITSAPDAVDNNGTNFPFNIIRQ